MRSIDPGALDAAVIAMAMAAGWTDPVAAVEQAYEALNLRGKTVSPDALSQIVDWLRGNAE